MPSTRLHKALLVSHEPVGRGYYRLLLRAPEAAAAQPGQFVMLRVSDNLDPLLARPFGISSLPSKSSVEIFYRVVGRGTEQLTAMKAGRTLSMLGPLGTSFPLPDKGAMPVLVAGGSGFPPLHFLSQRIKGCRAHLFVGARDKACLPPAAVLKSFRVHTARVHVATEDGSMGTRGMSTDLLQLFLRKRDQKAPHVIYACGPHGMLAAVSRIAREHGIPCFVSLEERMACGLGVCMGCSIPMKAGGYKRACKEGPVFDAREVDWSEQVMVKVRSQEFGVRSK